MRTILFILACLHCLAILEAQVCHVAGECETGVFLGSDARETYRDCMDSCQAHPNCFWISHFETTQQCKYYQDCLEIDTSECSDCYTGEVTCPDTLCSQTGFCQGASVGDTKTDTERGCQEDCFENTRCNWYTFYPDFQDCVLTSDCTPLIFSGSVYGERDCFTTDPGDGTDPSEIPHLFHSQTGFSSTSNSLQDFTQNS